MITCTSNRESPCSSSACSQKNAPQMEDAPRHLTINDPYQTRRRRCPLRPWPGQPRVAAPRGVDGDPGRVAPQGKKTTWQRLWRWLRGRLPRRLRGRLPRLWRLLLDEDRRRRQKGDLIQRNLAARRAGMKGDQLSQQMTSQHGIFTKYFWTFGQFTKQKFIQWQVHQ